MKTHPDAHFPYLKRIIGNSWSWGNYNSALFCRLCLCTDMYKLHVWDGRKRKKKTTTPKRGKKGASDSPPTHSCLSGDDACLSPLLPPCPSSRTQPTQKQQTAVLQPSKRWRGTVATGLRGCFHRLPGKPPPLPESRPVSPGSSASVSPLGFT